MLSKIEFEELKNYKHKPCVSIYAPMELTGDYDKNRIRWKNACQNARKSLEEKYPDADKMMAPAEELINDEKFWAYQSKTLAGFYSEGFHKHYHLVREHPQMVVVNDTFSTYPLLQEISNGFRIFILAISENEIKFYEAVQDGIYPVKIYDKVVRNYQEALSNIEEGSSLQHHTTKGGDAQFHTNSNPEDKDDIRTEQFLRRVDKGIMEIIHDEKVPMVLACVEEYYSIYREVTEYPYVSDHLIVGNPENLTPGELHDNIQPLLREMKNNKIKSFEKEYNERIHQNLTMNELPAIDKNASYKNVDKVLIPENYTAQISESEVHRLNEALMKIYESGGEIIFNIEEADHSKIKAISRFEIS